jgi:hypothetical protein
VQNDVDDGRAPPALNGITKPQAALKEEAIADDVFSEM